ncbi:MAG: DEAD/DEAH box helicase family protein [Trueperella sp.]|uniref:DEAD/DEAH box helicase n=1 Tax=Trueperella sp. TaxID=2699835 RepID=UPI0025F4297F|nr:DEAD/DEAH box helicase family protein [Trueperella sp.]MCI7306184.1 DEAD/DEAH box helicase family protein [Trueperella sp.]
MRYTLKDYQAEAVDKVLGNLTRAHDMYSRYGDASQFSLSAATGAGKTIMAAAIIESLFFGSDEFDFAPDPGAVVLWFSDDPSLNEQSRARIQSASPALANRLRIIEPPFAEPSLKPGNVYFLNTQKLSKNSLLVRADRSEAIGDQLLATTPDMLQTSIYDVLANTINSDGLTLYMVLDEAHRGMQPVKDRTTIVQRLINGHGSTPPIPIVLGISATVERFEEAMKGASNRTVLPSVEVDPTLVQASGLLKDDIVLSIPSESGTFDTVLLTRAVEKLRESTRAWREYAASQGDVDPVEPLLVVQMGDKPTDEDLTQVLTTIFRAWPELPDTSVANVFGEHQDLKIAGYHVPYLKPQEVQDRTWCRVLLAKTAISTGWDCPRAEVLVSFRPASDPTHITQLLGRMIRTPLARRIPGNELLNSVDCLLPFFNKDTAMSVAEMLMSGATGKDSDTGGGEGRRVLFDPVDLAPNPEVPDAVWEKFANLPTVTIPRGRTKPIKRLTALAATLAKDQIRENPVSAVEEMLCAALDGRAVQHREKVAKAREDVETMSGEELRRKIGGGAWTSTSFDAAVDLRALDDSYRAAARKLSPALARAYVDHLAPDNDEEALLDAQINVAALALVPEVVEAIESEADQITRQWLTETRVERKNLTDEQQAEYDRLEGMSLKPERIALTVPRKAQAETKERDVNGNERHLPTSTTHLLTDENGTYPLDLNDWEQRVLATEQERPGFISWYRNPDRAVKESLAIAYEDGNQWKALRPDFLFFTRTANGVAVDMVDPHGTHLSDALPKLRGLCVFAKEYGSEFRRIESVAESGGTLRVLDLTRPAVREAIETATDAKALYTSDLADDYQ